MEIKNLNTFIHVAELQSFSKAGERLGYSQPTVSVQIKQLEEELGVKLFDRIGHAVRLTDQGREMLIHAQQICHVSDRMQQTASGEPANQTVIRLATADSLAPVILQDFTQLRKKHPHISLKLTTAGTADLFRLLDQNEADMVCTLDSHIYNTRYQIAGEERIGLHFVVAAEHPLSQKGKLSRKDLLRQDFLLTEKGMSYRRLLDEWLARESLELQPVLEMGSADLICRLVEQGAGISFLPDYVTQRGVEEGRLVRLSAEGFRPELWKQILYRRDKWVSGPMQTVIDHLLNG